MSDIFVEHNGSGSHSIILQFCKKSLHTRDAVTICSKIYSIILESLQKCIFGEPPAATCWRLYYTPGGRCNRIITSSIICFDRHITWFPNASWIVIGILIARISFFCARQTTDDKAVEISGIHQHIIVAVGNKTGIVFRCICSFPYQLCYKILSTEHFITAFFQVLLLIVINTDKYYTVISQQILC